MSDASVRKQLAALLLLRLKLPGDHGHVAKEVVTLLVETQDSQQLEEAFATMGESTIVVLLSSLDEAAVNQLHVAMLPCNLTCRGLIDKELARRLASRLNEEHLKRLWQLLQGHLHAEQDSWARAAACLLSAHLGRMEVQLHNLSLEVLVEARKFLDSQDSTIAFAKDFFRYDLGVSMAEQWPLKSSAPIFNELAGRLSGEESEEKLQLLRKAHSIDESHPDIRASLRNQLHAHMLSEEEGDAFAMEGLFLKLALEEGYIPEEVLPKLTLHDHHLIEVSPDQLMKLCQQLVESNRQADGARVAVVAARSFREKGQERQSEEAFLKAFSLDCANKQAAEGLANAVTSAHERCAELEYRCDELKGKALEAKCEATGLANAVTSAHERCTELEYRCVELRNNGRTVEEALKAKCQALQKEMQGIQMAIVWDLSSYDFSNFRKGQCQESEKFELLSSGVTGWLKLYPKGDGNSSVGRAGLFLFVNKPAVVKWTCQSGSDEVKTEERDFSKDMINGKPDGFGNASFMSMSETNGSITVRILTVQLPGSALIFR